MKKIYILTICMAFFGYNVSAQKYVKPVGTGTEDGSSWANASADLQGMINASADGEEVWVVAGIYKPTEKLDLTSTDNRDKTFKLKAGVKIYGGFSGVETLLSQRNFMTNITILSGDLNSDNASTTGDAYHVVASAGNSTGAVLDGFTIQHGFADATGTVLGVRQNQGAAINITNEETVLNFSNLFITDNKCSENGNGGAGVYLSLNDGSNCIFNNVHFESNKATASGGAMYYISNSGSPMVTVSNSKVIGGAGNGINGTSGAGLYVIGDVGKVANFKVVNTIFSGNRASSNPGGGAIYLASYTNTSIINTTFYNNSSSNGALSYSNSNTTELKIYNSIFNKNSTASNGVTPKDISNGGDAVLDFRNNLFQLTPVEDTDPQYMNVINNTPTLLFFSTTSSDANFLKLVEGVATEKGDNAYVVGITKDLAGSDRIIHTNVDLGAYEFEGTLPVQLQSVNIKKVNNGAFLEWRVVSETDNEKFVIKRSTNGVDFDIIGEVYSQGIQNYSFTDLSPLKEINYYQLSQIDKDGTSQILALKTLNFDFTAVDVSVFPNPASDVINLKLAGISPSANITVQLVSITGNTVLSKQINTNNETSLEVSKYARGMYVLVIDDGKAVTKKEIILH